VFRPRLRITARTSLLVFSQVVCTLRVQVDLALRSTGLKILDDPRVVLPYLLLDLDGTAVIDEVAGLDSQDLGYPHSGRREQDV